MTDRNLNFNGFEFVDTGPEQKESIDFTNYLMNAQHAFIESKRIVLNMRYQPQVCLAMLTEEIFKHKP